MRDLERLVRPPAGKTRGQAFTEFIVWVFVLVQMIAGIMHFGRIYYIKGASLMASRYVAWKASRSADNGLSFEQVRQRVASASGARNLWDLGVGQYGFGGNIEQSQMGAQTNGHLNTGGSGGIGQVLGSALSGLDSSTTCVTTTMNNISGGLSYISPTVTERHCVATGTWNSKQIYGDAIIWSAGIGLAAWAGAQII